MEALVQAGGTAQDDGLFVPVLTVLRAVAPYLNCGDFETAVALAQCAVRWEKLERVNSHNRRADPEVRAVPRDMTQPVAALSMETYSLLDSWLVRSLRARVAVRGA